MTKSGKPVPGVQSEFRSFNITDADSVGISDNGLKEIMLAGWNDESFNVGADGKLGSASCDGGSSRVACAGEVSGGSKLSDEDGRTTVGFRTPNTPSAVLAVAMRVPAGAEASNLIQFVRIKVVSNEDFANSGINPIQAAIVVVPPLFDDQGRRVIKAGSQFNLALHAPGVPNTLFGKGFDFTYETSGLDEPVNGVNVIVPSGTAKCDFQNGQCLIPGGPFKVLRPTTLKFTIKPKDPKFPVMAASIEVPVVTGSVNSMILSLNPPGQAIQNACLNPLDYSQPCLTLSADSDVVDLYPVLIDQAGNFVAAPETLWNVTGPLTNSATGGVRLWGS
ncbi:MAG: hypothetical protein NTV34_16220 [Proteobacteria bacterium]|nr:hypothetical protein [Pseudomonadota bacterium]